MFFTRRASQPGRELSASVPAVLSHTPESPRATVSQPRVPASSLARDASSMNDTPSSTCTRPGTRLNLLTVGASTSVPEDATDFAITVVAGVVVAGVGRRNTSHTPAITTGTIANAATNTHTHGAIISYV